MEGMEGIEVSTEAMTLENAVELVRETDSGVISDWLKGLLPWFLNFGFQILLAVVVYAVGARIIKLVRSMVRRWMERADADIGVKQFIDSLVKYFLYFGCDYFNIFWSNHRISCSCAWLSRTCSGSCRPGDAVQFCRGSADSFAKALPCGRLHY